MNENRQKYTIADVQQDKLINLGLDLKDGYILTYLRDMSQLKKIVRKTINGKSHIWIDYKKLMTYLPILKINTEDALGRRLKKYETLKIVSKHIHRSMNGSYIFFHLTDKFLDLFEISKIEESDDEYNRILQEMGITEITLEDTPKASISNHPDEKSGGSGAKVGWVGMESRMGSDEKSGLNTSINYASKNNTSKNNTTTIGQPVASLGGNSLSESLVRKTIKELEYKISEGTTINLESLNPTAERLTEVIIFARSNNKGAGFVVDAIKNEYDLKPLKELKSLGKSDARTGIRAITNRIIDEFDNKVCFDPIKRYDELTAAYFEFWDLVSEYKGKLENYIGGKRCPSPKES